MKCVFCGCGESRVVDSRNLNDNGIRRRRECLKCGKRYTTYEVLESNPMIVTNVYNEREPFKLDKLVESLEYAFYCSDAEEKIGELALEIEKEMLAQNRQEVTTNDIVEVALKVIKEVDELAYLVYFVQHTDCKSLSDVRNFVL